MKHIAIIGAGLGGLTAGALLAKNGYKVTLLEQHNRVGGSATTFKRGDFTCEVGLHEMDGTYTSPAVVDVFEKLGVYNNVTFVEPDEFFKIYSANGSFTMPNGVEKVQSALMSRFPEESNAIENYLKTVEALSINLNKLTKASWYHYALFPFIFWNIIKYRTKSTQEVMDKMFKSDALKLILNSNIGYYNDSASTLSFIMHAVGQDSYFRGGGWFIKGGSQKLSDYLASIIVDHGGEVITKANVIACNEGTIEYIKKKEHFTIECDKVISNISPEQTYKLYDIHYTESKEIGNSLLTVYLGFRKSLKSVYGKGAYSNFIFDSATSLKDIDTNISKDALEKEFIFVDYSQIDSGLAPEGKSFGAVCFIDNFEAWDSLDKEAYKEKKEKLIKSVLQKLELHYSNISELVEYAEVGTAKTVQRYIKTPQGTAYGFKPSPKQFFRIPQVKSKRVDHLYFVGQWVIAGGFSPAIISGELCYREIIKH